MQLSQWLRQKNISQKNFARMIGKSPAAISRLVNGDLLPSGRMILAIDDATNGEVTLKDWAKQIKRTG